MSSVREEFDRDSHKPPEQLEREIDVTRAHMEHTLDLLQRKLSPGELIDEVLNMARRSGGDFAGNLTTQLRNNPLPVLLTGVGLAWLMSASEHPPRRDTGDDGDGRTSRAMHAAGDAANQVRDRAHDAAERAQELGHRARDAASDVQRRMHDAADSLRSGAGHARQSARNVSRQAREQYQHLLHEQPLLLGGLGLALGAALGAMAPRTEAEDELMGDYSDRAKREAGEAAHRQYEHARDTVERAANAAGEEISREQSQQDQGQST
jgi:ElaB/YqjD/DUF883 family membrane-anchored ribosome-binding protein